MIPSHRPVMRDVRYEHHDSSTLQKRKDVLLRECEIPDPGPCDAQSGPRADIAARFIPPGRLKGRKVENSSGLFELLFYLATFWFMLPVKWLFRQQRSGDPTPAPTGETL